jgi:UDP-3-O-[3-hydroxymyristoyl] glucosamine N-acyltransferase
MINPFFKNTGPHNINFLLKTINLENYDFSDDKITDIKDLNSSQKNEITFFHSKKYADLAKKTKASYCLTSENFQSLLPDSCKPIITDKVLLHTAQITKIFYPDSITDNYDGTVKDINETKFKDKVKFGKNVLIGENVKIGANWLIGHQT